MGWVDSKPKTLGTKTIVRCKSKDAKAELERLYKIESLPVGKGAFGKVYKARSLTDEDTLFAIKWVDIRGMSAKKVNEISNEVQILNSLDHPNIVKYYEIYEDNSSLYIVMEQCQGKTIYDKIASGEKIFEQDVCKIAQQLLRAVNHCNTNGVIHRDIKLENVIVDDFGNPKLIDFGLSKSATANQILKSMAGTPYYMAPEILSGKSYNEKVDIWSLGVVFYTMLWGYRPFDGDNAHQVFEAVKEGKYKSTGKTWAKVSYDARDLISRMLTVNPKKRISAQKALDHPWFGLINEIKIKSFKEEEDKIDTIILERLKAYKSVSTLKKAILNILVKMLKPKETNYVANAFK